MTANGWLQIILYLVVLLALVMPLGWYMARVYEGQSVGLNTLFAPAERLLYRLFGTREDEEQSWKQYAALIIPALIPLALRGVKYQAVGAAQLLQRNLLIYGLGGVVAPFVGIKLIDLLLTLFGLA
jgi:K+-transporting ATPase A subunit